MLTMIPDILTVEELKLVHRIIAKSAFVDGKLTAGNRAKRVKSNAQLDKQTDEEKSLNDLIRNALRRNSTFNAVTFPNRIAVPIIGRYEPGMEYGFHIDDTVMNKKNPFRTDIATTVFLNDPTDYTGGSLVIDSPYGEQEIKLLKGWAAIYSATTLHRVTPVEDGQRLVAVTWIQSRIRDPWQRELLADLDKVRHKLAQLDPESREADLAFKSYGNLLRMWAEV